MGTQRITKMWNNTDTPLAYLFTFRCHGTWLHGDERGAVDRFHNRYRAPLIQQNKPWHDYNNQTLKQEPVTLDEGQRRSVEHAIRQTCELREWLLQAVNVRTNHVHLVAAIGGARPGSALNAFKANATRQMRQDGVWPHSTSPWVAGGSKRYLWNQRSISRALDYVINGQGGPIPDLDAD
jgi:REP element-mobilizing transposase RayT